MTVSEHKEKLTEQLTELRHRLADGKTALAQMEQQASRLEGAIAMCDALLQEPKDAPLEAGPVQQVNGRDEATP